MRAGRDSCLSAHFYHTGWPKKTRNGILPVMQVYNDWYQWMGVSSPEKNDTKISNFG